MFDRSNYTINDFLLFSARVYDRMFELHNAAVWPAHFLALAIGLYLIAVAFNPNPRAVRIAFGLLAIVWLFVASTFLYARYATINWAVLYVIPFFALMALLLAFFAVRANPPEVCRAPNIPNAIGFGVLLFSLFGYPLLSVLTDKPWYAAQVFGVAPDPTSTATLGFLAMSCGSGVLPAMIIPALWAIVTALTLYVLGSNEFIVAPLVATICLIACIAGGSRRRAP